MATGWVTTETGQMIDANEVVAFEYPYEESTGFNKKWKVPVRLRGDTIYQKVLFYSLEEANRFVDCLLQRHKI